MVDINLIRSNPDLVKANIKKREMNLDDVVDAILEVDAKRRELTGSTEAMKAEQNACTKKIPAMKKAGEDVAPVMAEMKALSEKIKAAAAELGELEEKQKELMLSLPNMPDEDVAAGGKEQNVPVHYFGEQPKFDFEPKNHVDLCESLGMIDYPRGAKVGGNGAWIYRGAGARLEWALLNFFVNEHLADGYELILPPHMLNYECGYVAGQFPKFSDEVYWIQNPTSADKKFMLPTAETVLVNLHRDEILTLDELPKKYIAYTPCYRREAGTYRASERGMIRGHQFNKVEMFAYTTPEQSEEMHQLLIRKACRLVEGLGLHYRLSKLAAGDCSASMATTWDVELWIPSMNEYKECSSVSNAMDYQARRGNMRFRRTGEKKTEFMHTLNGSGLATSRLIPAIVEQFQRADGSVGIPEVLQPFLGGVTEIRP